MLFFVTSGFSIAYHWTVKHKHPRQKVANGQNSHAKHGSHCSCPELIISALNAEKRVENPAPIRRLTPMAQHACSPLD